MPETIKVTVGTLQGTQKGFFLNGKPSSRFTLLAGETYIFDQSDSSNAMHPLRLSLKPDGIHGGGVEFNGGVTVAGVQPGQAGSALTLQLPLGTAALHVYCVSHSGMGGGGRLFVASNANDTISGASESDLLQGFAGNDGLWGLDGNDTLDGGAGVDMLRGGAGDDLYVADSAADVLTENANEGTDTIRSSVSLALAANFENLELTGSSAINATGNAVANILTGNAGANQINGAAGADTMRGGAGNDTYNVENSGDVVSEVLNSGTDAVQSSVSHILSADVENLTLTGTAPIDGTGNALANAITGNSAANRISAGAGNDTLDGGAGVDSLIGGAGIDSLNGGAGNDTMAGCFFGANGGRSETDTLVGGVGNDIFQLGYSSGRFYDDGNKKNAGRTDYVLITDFTVGQDKLQLDGAAAGYYLAASGVTGVVGTGLWAEQGTTDELLAIIRSANTTALNAANTVNTSLFV